MNIFTHPHVVPKLSDFLKHILKNCLGAYNERHKQFDPTDFFLFIFLLSEITYCLVQG